MDRQFLNNKNKRKIEPLLCKYIFQERVYMYTDQVERSIDRDCDLDLDLDREREREREREGKTYILTKREEEITAVRNKKLWEDDSICNSVFLD